MMILVIIPYRKYKIKKWSYKTNHHSLVVLGFLLPTCSLCLPVATAAYGGLTGACMYTSIHVTVSERSLAFYLKSLHISNHHFVV